MKLKKIASLALAGVMAVSMLAGCSTTSTTPEGPNGGDDVITTPVNDMTSAFQSGLSDKAELKVNMSYSADLQDDLAYAAGEVGYATILDFCTAIRTAGTIGGSGVRTVANFDQDGKVYVANVNNGDWAVWTRRGGMITNDLAGDLSVAAADMNALNVKNAFNSLMPKYNEVEDDTVTMLFAVDDTIGEANAVKQVGQLVNFWIEQLRIDDDNTLENQGKQGKQAVVGKPAVDATTFHYVYNGSVAIENKSIDSHDMGVNLIAVEITRVATLPHV